MPRFYFLILALFLAGCAHIQHTSQLIIKKEYFKNGAVKSVSKFKAGKKHGLQKSYFENGQTKEEAYYNEGELIESRQFEEGGNLLVESNYIEGKRVTVEYHEGGKWLTLSEATKDEDLRKSYYPNGRLRATIHSKKGKKDGVYVEYAENGNPQKVLSYKSDKLDGICRLYDDQGNVSAVAEYANNQMMWRNGYFPNGALWRKEIFKNGKLKTFQEYDEQGYVTKEESYR